jgi:ABC-2 type transport system permease protein
MLAVARRELRLAFAAPTAGVFLAAFSAISVLMAFEIGGLFEAGLAELTAWFQFLPWLLCIFAPALTMSAWAGERRDGSLDGLLALPVTSAALVVGKFLAHWLLSMLGLLVVLPLWLMVALLGPMDHGAHLATLAGACLTCGAYVGISLAAGARAANQVVAFVLSALACVLLTALGLPAVGGLLQGLAGDPGLEAARSLALLSQFDGVQRGAIEASTLVYFFALISAALAIAILLIGDRRAGFPARVPLQQRLHVPLAVLGLITLFVGVTMIGRASVSGWRIDATASKTFTLSQATKEVLAGLDTPVDVTLFVPASADGLDPALGAYATRVQDTLRTYARQSGRRLRFDVVAVAPFSEAEDRALEAGIEQLQSPTPGGTPGYFGMTLTNTIDQMAVIPFLEPGQEARLEYQITSALVRLQQEVPPRIAVLSSLPWLYGLDAAGQTGAPVAPVARALSDAYPVSVLAEDFDQIPAGTSVLFIAQPFELTPSQSFAVDQFLMRQGRLLLALDPALSAARDVGGRPVAGLALADLLAGWGITVDTRATADRENALPVQAMIDGRSMIVPDPLYFQVPRSGLSGSDPVTAGLDAGLHFATAGSVSVSASSGLDLSPLATTSPASRTFDARFVLQSPGPDQILADWPISTGQTTIAARLTGPVTSAFAGSPSPPPNAGSTTQSQRLNRSTDDTLIYLVGDADFLYDGLYVGETGPVADNEAFVLNMIDTLAGGAQLASIRSRPVRARRMEVVDAINSRSQTQLLEEQRQLEVRVADLTAQITVAGANQASPGQIEAFRRDLLAARQRLRSLQTASSNQVGAIKTGMMVVGAGLVPFGWLGFSLWIYRRRSRRARRVLS